MAGIDHTDPVEDKARELAKAGGVDFDEQEPEGAEMLLGMAHHVLGRKPGRDGAHHIGGRTIRPAGVYVEMDGYEMRPETAVDLACALLAAAKAAAGDGGADQ